MKTDDAELADRLFPLLRDRLMKEPLIWGDPARVTIDPTAYLVNALLNTSSGRIVIEPWVFFGHNVSLIAGTHDITKIDKARQDSWPTEGCDITIRRGVWLASNVTVVGPAVVGEHAVVAAGSVVIGDLEPRGLYAGVPARLVKRIETQE